MDIPVGDVPETRLVVEYVVAHATRRRRAPLADEMLNETLLKS
jgi:hypothetical protein